MSLGWSVFNLFLYKGHKLTYGSADWYVCSVCGKRAYGELVGGLPVCYRCVFNKGDG